MFTLVFIGQYCLEPTSVAFTNSTLIVSRPSTIPTFFTAREIQKSLALLFNRHFPVSYVEE